MQLTEDRGVSIRIREIRVRQVVCQFRSKTRTRPLGPVEQGNHQGKVNSRSRGVPVLFPFPRL